jgi:hypothetical protein
VRLERGVWPCRGQACQKHPSTKTANLFSANTKSGLTSRFCAPRQAALTRMCLRHPLMPSDRKTATSRISVPALPRLRITAMTRDRFVFEKMSATRRRIRRSQWRKRGTQPQARKGS